MVFHLLRCPWGSIRMVSNYNFQAILGADSAGIQYPDQNQFRVTIILSNVYYTQIETRQGSCRETPNSSNRQGKIGLIYGVDYSLLQLT